MADAKISALTNLTAADAINDMIPIVDVSDTPPASGNTKRISINNILSSSPTASGALTVTGLVTAGSAAITGAATVGTTLGVTGVSTFAAGTAALPALTTTGDANTGIYYPAADTFAITTGGTERARFNSSGAFVLAGGTTGANGIGVAFPATQSASSDANCLDDYEEGTFTPALIGTTADGVGTYADRQGNYTKVGRQVTVQIFLNWTAHTGTGNIRLSGLPFTSLNSFEAASVGYWNNIAITASNTPMAYVVPSATTIELLQMTSGGGAMAPIAMDTSGGFMISATYFV
jgi:hypothetical protein